MLVPLITYETIARLYGEGYARLFFRPYSSVRRTG